VNVVCCCVFNALWNKDIVQRPQRKAIKQQIREEEEADLNYIAKFSNNPTRRKTLLTRNGRSLPSLLSAVLPAIDSSAIIQQSKDEQEKNKKVKKGKKGKGKTKAAKGTRA
jgi:hypothetical protein